MDSYYRRIRDMREDNDMTQKEVSDYLGMKQSQYSRYERGHRDIPTDVLIKLAFLFDTLTDYLLGITDVRTPYQRLIDYNLYKIEN